MCKSDIVVYKIWHEMNTFKTQNAKFVDIAELC